jgi:iron complex transport system substrate-binding protein
MVGRSLLIVLLWLSSTIVCSATPKRVVSMELCTDQLAMLLAAPGQLHSVSHVASDPLMSPMTEKAKSYTLNYGKAEEIYMMQPDLVVAGRFSDKMTINMLKKLGIKVELFDLTSNLNDVRERLLQMGKVLNREVTAKAMIADFDKALAKLQTEVTRHPRAALYYANGYTSGEKTLASQILTTAGFENVALEAGFASGGIMPLEILAITQPEALIISRSYPVASRSEEILNHPVVQAIRKERTAGSFTDKDWVCGTPYILRALEEMRSLHNSMLDH